MISFYINGDETSVQLENEKTIGDVLHSFELTCEENNAAVIGISIDDKIITAELFDEIYNNPLESNTKFEFTVVTRQSIKDSFAQLAILFDELSIKMEQIPTEFQNGNTLNAVESIKNLADNIDRFCHLAALASLFPDTFKNSNINGMNFKDFFEDFSPILHDFEDAMKNNDTVLIGDLSEYEICPRLKSISEALKQF